MDGVTRVPVDKKEMLVIGLMSGTSCDGIDAALVRVEGEGYDRSIELLREQCTPYAPALKQAILALAEGTAITAEAFGSLDQAIGVAFAQSALALAHQAGFCPEDIALIGSHGQTVHHQPPEDSGIGFSLQLGSGTILAHQTGIPTVNNFRAADMALGGQGAPLVPMIDFMLYSEKDKVICVQNLGGIGNVTYLPCQDRDAALAFDTGPGNMLLDGVVSYLTEGKQTYDQGGLWASQGMVQPERLAELLEDPYLRRSPPKSTGREYFGKAYLKRVSGWGFSGADLLATLTEWTARSVADSYRAFLPQMPEEVLLGGGGVHNQYLFTRLQDLLHPAKVSVVPHADAKEAIAFALLAVLHQAGLPGNLPGVTGARGPALLGTYHPCPRRAIL
jgi:anhydro-N-acetylmuramic acid kinase